jgi:hypothetical protein
VALADEREKIDSLIIHLTEHEVSILSSFVDLLESPLIWGLLRGFWRKCFIDDDNDVVGRNREDSNNLLEL